ncbi:hypothetical protein P8452_61301 [Trifolium repens]|nr:hypothetical protein P8452_61301 [Trifolium repens]
MLPNPTITVFFEILQALCRFRVVCERMHFVGLEELMFLLMCMFLRIERLISIKAIKILNMIKLYGKPIRVKRKIGHIELTEI